MPDLWKAMLRRHKTVTILFVLAALTSAACAGPMKPKVVESEPDAIGEKAIAFGKAQVISSKTPSRWTETDCTNDLYWTCPDSFRLVFLKDGDSTPIMYRLTGDGSFKIPLEPGRYFLAEWEWYQEGMHSLNDKFKGAIGASFEIAADTKATYIGDLVIRFRGAHYSFEVLDRYDQAAAALVRNHPELEASVESEILKAEGPPRSDTYLPICEAAWQVDCDDRIIGVKPLRPPQTGSDFPEVENLSPTLEWVGSASEGVTYDVVIYEALPYGLPPHMSYVQGRMVDYESDISGTTYRVKKALKPHSPYFWSIRLRKGDVISDWSTTSYKKFGFLFVGFISESESRIPFRFETP